MKWLDLSRYNAKISVCNINGVSGVVIAGTLSNALIKHLGKSLRYQNVANFGSAVALVTKFHTSRDTGGIKSIDWSPYLDIFTDAKLIDVDKSFATSLWEGIPRRETNAFFAAAESNQAKAMLDGYEAIGMNINDEMVMQGNSGDRFIQLADNNLMIEDGRNSARFLDFRLGDSRGMNDAIELLLREIKNGTVIDQARLEQLISLSQRSQEWQPKEQRTFLLSLYRNLEQVFALDLHDVYHSTPINENVLSTLSRTFQQIPSLDTDLPLREKMPGPDLAYVARQFLQMGGDAAKISLINHGALGLAILLPKDLPMEYTGHISSANEAIESQFTNLNSVHRDIESQYQIETMATLANFERENIKPITIDELTFTRQDHLQAYRALKAMPEDGTMMLVLEADDPFNVGLVQHTSETLHHHIFHNYHVADAFDMDPMLLGSNHPANAKRVYLVTGRRAEPSKVTAPNSLKVLESSADVMTFADALVENYHNRITDELSVSRDELQQTNSVTSLLAAYTQSMRTSSELEINPYHARYTPLTNLAYHNTSVQPVNQVNATREASKRLVRAVGNPDVFLLDEMKMSKEEITAVLDAEQIDALTMAIFRMKQNKGFVQGDDAGKGKGRVLAALMYWNIVNGNTPVFTTKEPSLLSDIYRDLLAMNMGDKIRPFFLTPTDIVNKNTGETYFSGKELKRIADQYVEHKLPLDKEFNCILTGYTQIRKLRNLRKRHLRSKKTFGAANYEELNDRAQWLHDHLVSQHKQAVLIMDESHNVSGASSSQARVARALMNAANGRVVRASATWAKHQKNIARCDDLFPVEYDAKDLEDMIRLGGNPILEVLTNTLIAEGAMVRREHDLGNRKVEVKVASDFERNKKATDQLANILAKGQELANMQFKAAEQSMYSEDNIEQFSFTSGLHLLSSEFSSALNVDEALSEAIKSIQNDEKPVIGLDKTGETTLKYLHSVLSHEIALKTGKPVEKNARIPLDSVPTFKVALQRWLNNEQVRKIRVQLEPDPAEELEYAKRGEVPPIRFETQSFHWKDELDPSSKEYKDIALLVSELNQMIDQMPDLPLSPYDHIRLEAEKKGCLIGEISGREFGVFKVNGEYFLGPMPRKDKEQVMREFNTHSLEGVIVSRSGTEGISLHADKELEQFGEKALFPRHTIIASTFNNILDEMQFLNRTERKNQVVPSRATKISSGMPAEARLHAMCENNRARMSAATTSNSRNVRAVEGVVNFMNSFGDRVVAEYLGSNPHLFEKLGFDEEKAQSIIENLANLKTNSFRNLVGTFLGRLMLLPYSEQEKILDDITERYNNLLAFERSQGIDPLNARHLHGELKVTSTEVLKGTVQSTYQSEFDKPVIAKKVVYTTPPVKINYDTVSRLIRANKTALKPYNCGDGDMTNFAIRLMDQDLREEVLNSALKSESVLSSIRARLNKSSRIFKTIDEALNSKEPNLVKTMDNEVQAIIEILHHVKVGQVMKSPYSFSNSEQVIVGVHVPVDKEDWFKMGRYGLNFVTDHGQVNTTIDFDTLYHALEKDLTKLPTLMLGQYTEDHALNEKFEELTKSGNKEYFVVLDGNLIESARLNSQHRFGGLVTYTDDTGVTRHVFRCKESVSLSKLKDMNFKLDASDKNTIVSLVKSNQLNAMNMMFTFHHDTWTPEGTHSKRIITLMFDQNAPEFTLHMPLAKGNRIGLTGPDPFQPITLNTGKINKVNNLPTSFVLPNQEIDTVLTLMEDEGWHLTLSPRMLAQFQSINEVSQAPSTEQVEKQVEEFGWEEVATSERDIQPTDETQIDIEEVLEETHQQAEVFDARENQENLHQGAVREIDSLEVTDEMLDGEDMDFNDEEINEIATEPEIEPTEHTDAEDMNDYDLDFDNISIESEMSEVDYSEDVAPTESDMVNDVLDSDEPDYFNIDDDFDFNTFRP